MRHHRFLQVLTVAVAVASVGLLSASTASARSCRSVPGLFALHVAGTTCAGGRSVQHAVEQDTSGCCSTTIIVYSRGTTWRCRYHLIKQGPPYDVFGDPTTTGQSVCVNRRHSARVTWKVRGQGDR